MKVTLLLQSQSPFHAIGLYSFSQFSLEPESLVSRLCTLSRSFPFICITGIHKFTRQILNSKFFLVNLSSADFQIPHYVLIFVSHKNQIQNYETFLPITVWLNRKLVFLMAYNASIFKTPLLPALQFQSANQIVIFSCSYILLHLYNVITNNFRILHTNNQIHFLKKETPFLAVWLSRKLVFFMGLQYCHIQDSFPPAVSTFLSQTNC
jgi:hypothetical protein